MIFKQWKAVLDGRKTQTRRIVRAGENGVLLASGRNMLVIGVLMPDGRPRFQVKKEYPVVPRRGAPAVRDEAGNIRRVRIRGIRRERVQAISEADALAEGMSSVAEYAALWDSINKKKGTRWVDNPDVWVLVFELA